MLKQLSRHARTGGSPEASKKQRRCRMQLKPLTLAILATALIAELTACSGDGNESTGQTIPASGQISGDYYLACVDANTNLQCDDGDSSRIVSSTGDTGLAPQSAQYTLIEKRDEQNRRTQLLISESGSATVNGHTTLRTLLRAAGKSENEISGAVASFDVNALEQGYATTMSSWPIALSALAAYSNAVLAQGTATPALDAFAPLVGSVATAANWQSDEATSTLRQLSAQGSLVLNNSEANRLYLFDAAVDTVDSTEIDLVPLDPMSLVANVPRVIHKGLALLRGMVDVFVDTASAATSFTGTPTTGSAVVLNPGQGIAAAQIINNGSEAIVNLNMLNGSYNEARCLESTAGNEGLFRVSLQDSASIRMLADTPACVHSGFSLMTSDPAGAHVAAWDSTAKKLWLLDGTTMQPTNTIDLGLANSTPPQALAMTPGGHYLAVAGYGRLVLVDVDAGRVITQFEGSWGNVAQVAFANGARSLLVASDESVHTLQLDNALQLISRSTHTVANSGDTLRALAISAGGDSVVAVDDNTAHWKSTDGKTLADIALPAGMQVQQAVLAEGQLMILTRGLQDQDFSLLRVPLPIPSLTTISLALATTDE